jgi:hypothetical protein
LMLYQENKWKNSKRGIRKSWFSQRKNRLMFKTERCTRNRDYGLNPAETMDPIFQQDLGLPYREPPPPTTATGRGTGRAAAL